MPQCESDESGQNCALAEDKLTAGLFCLHICAALRENRDKSLNVASKGQKKRTTVYVCAAINFISHSVTPSN